MRHRITTLLAALLLPMVLAAWDQVPPRPTESCQKDAPYGMPSGRQGLVIICRAAYVLAHDPVAKIPAWVSYTIDGSEVVGCIPRSNNFAADASLPRGQRAELEDYAKSGYDIGHLANAANMAFDRMAMDESFLLSNMSPQLPGLNRGIWKVLETTERAWAVQSGHRYTVYAGNIYGQNGKTIGPNAVMVPDYLYKIIIDNDTKQVLAFLFPHREGQGSNLNVVLASVSEIESMANLTFPLPHGVDRTFKAITIWPVDLRVALDAKKVRCKIAQ